MICGLTFYQIAWFFLEYSFLGWCLEVVYHAVHKGVIVNRGFLNGPFCPVYGFGVLAVLMTGNECSRLLSDSSSNAGDLSLPAMFVMGVLLATAIELVAGWLLDTLFHMRWWDYSKKPFNFHGYICLEFSLLWGTAIVFVLRIIHPALEAEPTNGLIPEKYGWILLAVAYALLAADLVVTVLTVRGLNKRLEELNRLRGLMRTPSDAMTQRLGGGAMEVAQKIEEGQVQAELAREELVQKIEETREQAGHLRAEAITQAARVREEARADAAAAVGTTKAAASTAVGVTKDRAAAARANLEARIDELLSESTRRGLMRSGRLIRAFPDLRHRSYPEEIESIRRKIAARSAQRGQADKQAGDTEGTD